VDLDEESFTCSIKVSWVGKNTLDFAGRGGSHLGTSECRVITMGPPNEVVPFCRHLLATPNVILTANVANALVPTATSRS
jgi:hypothetical protein